MSKKIHIKTYGCQMNVYDSDRMQDLMNAVGYETSEEVENSDMVIINTCHIREKASEKLFSDLGRIRPFKEKMKEAGKQMKGVDIDMLWKEALEESRAYSQFKKEATMRSKPDQLHEAAKMIQRKLDEVTKLLEFTSQMRNDLSEGEANVEYKHNTKKVFERIHSKVVEVYTKVKGLK